MANTISFSQKTFEMQLQSYLKKYPYYEADPYDFHQFWKWKVKIESEGESVLDDANRGEAFRRLTRALPKWQTYRPYAGCLDFLRASLERIAQAYNQIRSYDLLDLEKVPEEQLQQIWHELGRAKEPHGRINQRGIYYIVAVSKPLLFLWGQTLAFDSVVRSNIPRFGFYSYVVNDTRWSFETWMKIMKSFAEVLRNQPEMADLFIKESKRKYGKDAIVPYGRFLDICYYVE